jgi:hypothetical protein
MNLISYSSTVRFPELEHEMLLPVVPHSKPKNTFSGTFPQKFPRDGVWSKVQLPLQVTPPVQGIVSQLKDCYLHL